MMRCPYCKKRIDENAKMCEHCGKELTLLTKYKGQHVGRKDLLQVDTFVAVITFILMIISLFLPVVEYTSADGTVSYTLLKVFGEASTISGYRGITALVLVLFLMFSCIFLSAWFLGEKNAHYFWAGASGSIGSWVLYMIGTVLIGGACSALGFTGMSLTSGYYLWVIALLLELCSLLLYRWRTNVLERKKNERDTVQTANAV